MRSSRITVVVSGMVAGNPGQGGATWAVLQYVVGLRALGHEVFLVEPVQAETLQPIGVPLAGSAQATYFRAVTRAFDLEEPAALLLAGTQETVGLTYAAVQRISRRADLLINIAGMLTDATLRSAIPVQAYLDLDPGFTQLWAMVDGVNMRFPGHTHFVTVGTSLGRPDRPVPTGGLPWISTLPPVVLAHWPVAQRITYDALTTVAHWRSYGSTVYQGVFYGQKAHSLRPFFALPGRTDAQFLLALAIHPDECPDLDALHHNGWHLLDPAVVARTPAAYRRFIAGSRAEFGLAKAGYVAGRTGWLSDRSACYLASGRPVLAQDTGFRVALPTGEGLWAWESADDVLAGLAVMRGDYPRHARAARALAEEYFASDVVLNALLTRLGGAG